MMGRIPRWMAPLAWSVVALVGTGSAHAYDDVRRLPPPSPGTVIEQPTEETIQRHVQGKLQQRFARAAGAGSTLTAQQAKAAGWGFVADHFREIDTAGKGYVTLPDITRFMSARSPQALMQQKR